jgi:hypothetical protein
MNEHELRAVIVACLHRVAPEANLDTLAADAELRDVVELDSIDFLTFVEELYTRTGIDVPERDYPSLTTLESCVGYLGGRLGHSQPA